MAMTRWRLSQFQHDVCFLGIRSWIFEWVFGCAQIDVVDVRFRLKSVEFISLHWHSIIRCSMVKPYVTSQRWTGEAFSAENGWMWHTQNDSVKPMQNNKWNYSEQVINFIVSFGLFTYPQNSRCFFLRCVLCCCALAHQMYVRIPWIEAVFFPFFFVRLLEFRTVGCQSVM